MLRRVTCQKTGLVCHWISYVWPTYSWKKELMSYQILLLIASACNFQLLEVAILQSMLFPMACSWSCWSERTYFLCGSVDEWKFRCDVKFQIGFSELTISGLGTSPQVPFANWLCISAFIAASHSSQCWVVCLSCCCWLNKIVTQQSCLNYVRFFRGQQILAFVFLTRVIFVFVKTHLVMTFTFLITSDQLFVDENSSPSGAYIHRISSSLALPFALLNFDSCFLNLSKSVLEFSKSASCRLDWFGRSFLCIHQRVKFGSFSSDVSSFRSKAHMSKRDKITKHSWGEPKFLKVIRAIISGLVLTRRDNTRTKLTVRIRNNICHQEFHECH